MKCGHESMISNSEQHVQIFVCSSTLFCLNAHHILEYELLKTADNAYWVHTVMFSILQKQKHMFYVFYIELMALKSSASHDM